MYNWIIFYRLYTQLALGGLQKSYVNGDGRGKRRPSDRERGGQLGKEHRGAGAIMEGRSEEFVQKGSGSTTSLARGPPRFFFEERALWPPRAGRANSRDGRSTRKGDSGIAKERRPAPAGSALAGILQQGGCLARGRALWVLLNHTLPGLAGAPFVPKTALTDPHLQKRVRCVRSLRGHREKGLELGQRPATVVLRVKDLCDQKLSALPKGVVGMHRDQL